MNLSESTELLKNSKEISDNIQIAIIETTKIIQKTQGYDDPAMIPEMLQGLRKLQEAQFWFQYVQGVMMQEIKDNPASKLVVRNQ